MCPVHVDNLPALGSVCVGSPQCRAGVCPTGADVACQELQTAGGDAVTGPLSATAVYITVESASGGKELGDHGC